MKACFGTQVENRERKVFGDFHGFSNQPIFCAWIIKGLGHQGLERQPETVCCLSFGNIGVQVIEAANGRQFDVASLGRIGVYIIKMRKVRTIFQGACQRQSMAFDRFDLIGACRQGQAY